MAVKLDVGNEGEGLGLSRTYMSFRQRDDQNKEERLCEGLSKGQGIQISGCRNGACRPRAKPSSEDERLHPLEKAPRVRFSEVGILPNGYVPIAYRGMLEVGISDLIAAILATWDHYEALYNITQRVVCFSG